MWEPHDFYDMYCNDQEKWLKSRPICEHCKERIQDEDLIDENGTLFHEECFEEILEKYIKQHRRCTENYAV